MQVGAKMVPKINLAKIKTKIESRGEMYEIRSRKITELMQNSHCWQKGRVGCVSEIGQD